MRHARCRSSYETCQRRPLDQKAAAWATWICQIKARPNLSDLWEMMLMRLGQTTACPWLIPHRVQLIRGGGEQSGSQRWRTGVWAGGTNPPHFPQMVPEYQRTAWYSFSESISALTSSEKRRTERPEAISFAPPTWLMSPFLHQRPAAATNVSPWKMAPATGGLRSLVVGETIWYRFNRQHSLFLPKCARHICKRS